MTIPIAVVYPPPIVGTPYLAAVFLDGRVIYCESVETRKKTKALLEAVAERMIVYAKRAACSPETTNSQRTLASIALVD